MTQPPHPHVLLDQTRWLRDLARRLVHDPDVADDLAQDACVSALEHPPAGGATRPWLSRVLRNARADRRRASVRRGDSELAAARPEHESEQAQGTEDLVARVAIQRELSRSVLELAEPYRTTLLLRYFEELPPRAIAKRMEVPVSTVKTRLARGLERLRERLSESHGDRRAWTLALVPLLERPAGLTETLLGGLLVTTSAKIFATVLTVAAAVTALVVVQGGDPGTSAATASERPTATEEPAVVAEAQAPPETPRAEADRTALAPAREPGAAPSKSAPAAAPAEPSVFLSGLVVDLDGGAVSGARVGYEDDSLAEAARCDASGRFRIEAPRERSHLAVLDPQWSNVLTAFVDDRRPDDQAFLVAAPAVDLAGSVLDEWGRPLADARVSVDWPDTVRARFDAVLDRAEDARHETRSAADGTFALTRAPSFADASLRVMLGGYPSLELPVPVQSDAALRLVLRQPRIRQGVLLGRVLDHRGEPVHAARVGFGLNSTITDEAGEFRFDTEDEETWNHRASMFLNEVVRPARMVALAPGSLPGTYEAEVDELGEPLWPPLVEIRLGAEPLTIEGRVVDADGAPLAGWNVWVGDTTFLGFDEESSPIHAEHRLAGDGPSSWNTVQTDAEGRFELRGLLDREYRLEAMDEVTLLRVRSKPTAAGSRGVELRVPADFAFERLRGRLVSRRGEPVPGASVRGMADVHKTRFREQTIGTQHAVADSTTTDEDGRFELLDVPKTLAYLRIDGEELLPLEYGRGEEGGLVSLVGEDPAEVEIVVDMRCHFHVKLSPDDPADSLRILDGDGQELPINLFMARGRRTSRTMPLSDARTGTLAASDAAETLVLLRGEEELRRVPVRLEPGEVRTLEL